MTGTRRFDRDRRRIAYLFAFTASGISIYLAYRQALDYGAFLILGGLCTAVFVLLGLPIDPRKVYDEPDKTTGGGGGGSKSPKRAPVMGKDKGQHNARMATGVGDPGLCVLRMRALRGRPDGATRQPSHA